MAESVIVSVPSELLNICLKIVRTLHGVQPWLRPAPLTMTSLANECLGLCEMLRQGQNRMIAAQATHSHLVSSLEALLLGCSMTISVIDECSTLLSHEVESNRSSATGSIIACSPLRLWKENDMEELLSQIRGYQNRLMNLIEELNRQVQRSFLLVQD